MAAQDTTVSLPTLKDLSVDELFQQHLVRVIQKLYAEYLAQVGQAKHDLHALVGAKYRDLIRIAEEVDQMNLQSSQIDSSLADLSYRRSNYAQFGSSASSKFDAKVRLAKAQQARKLLQTTILNNVINNQIIGYDLKLRSNAVPSTAALVHLAKLYHTVSSAFRTTLDANPHMLKNFLRLRANFVNYLEEKISQYSSNVSISDLSSPHLILKQANSWVECQSLDFADAFDEDDLEELDDWDTLGLNSLGTGFVPQSLPISNLIVGYLIVNCDNEDIGTTEKLAERIISLRYKYFTNQLRLLIESQSSRISDLNFLAIFSYIENTCQIIRKYLVEDGFLEIQSRLTGLKSWNPAGLLGFHNWMDLQMISFPKDKFTALSQKFLSPDHPLLIAFASYLISFLPRVITTIEEGNDGYGATCKLQFFHNAIASLRKLEILTLQVDMKSMAAAIVSQSQLLPELQDVVLSSVEEIILRCQSLLATGIVPLLNQTESTIPDHEPFTLEFVSTIDTDVGSYIDGVINVASVNDTLQSHAKTNSIHSRFKDWLALQRSLLTLISPQSDVRSRLEKLLKKNSGDSSNFELWGEFSLDSVSDKFDSMSISLKSSLLKKLSEFKQALTNRLTSEVDVINEDLIFFLLTLILILRKNLAILDLPESHLEADIDNEVIILYRKAFDCLLSIDSSLNPKNVLSNQSISNSAYDGVSIPTAPQMLVYSMMNQLASRLLHSDKFSENELYLLYSDDIFRDKFVEVKNIWIRENLLNEIDVSYFTDGAELPNTPLDLEKQKGATSECNLEPLKLLVAQVRQLFANAVFLLQFTEDDPILSSGTTLDTLTKKFEAMCLDVALEESVVENIVRGVTAFYQAGKEIYMPLLLT